MSINAFEQTGRFYRGNIHTHSTRSDGRLSPEETCAFYQKHGYDFLMLSDHFLKDYDFPITDTQAFRNDQFTTLIGAELHAPATSHGELWHIVAAGLPLDFTPPKEGEKAVELAQRAFDAGAFIGLAHPAWSGLSIEEARPMKMAHAIEIFNSGSGWETARSDGFYLLDALVNEGRRLSGFAVDDAHFHFKDALGAWIMVKAPALDPDLLLAAMKSGDYYSSQGPEIVSLNIKDNEIEIQSSPACTISIIGRGSRAKYLCGESLTKANLPLKAFRNDWFRVVIIEASGKRAWSNPIWLENL